MLAGAAYVTEYQYLNNAPYPHTHTGPKRISLRSSHRQHHGDEPCGIDHELNLHVWFVLLVSNTAEVVVPVWPLDFVCGCYSQPSLSKHAVTFDRKLPKVTV